MIKDTMVALARLFAGAANGGIHHDGVIVVADDLKHLRCIRSIKS